MIDLKAIKAREEAATEGPWQSLLRSVKSVREDRRREAIIASSGLSDGHRKEAEANMEFIAHARTDVPALIAEVERLRAEIAEWVKASKSAMATHIEFRQNVRELIEEGMKKDDG